MIKSGSGSVGMILVVAFALVSVFPTIVQSQCLEPFVWRGSVDRSADEKDGYVFVGDSNCTFPCPSPFFKQWQWDQMNNMAYILGSISFVATLFNIFTYGILNRVYDRHAICIVFMSFAFWLVMLTDVVVSSVGPELNCPEKNRFAVQSDAGCLATGLIFQFGVVSAILWWSTMSLDLYLTIRKIKKDRNHYKKYYIIINNAIAIVLTFVPIGGKQYGYGFSALGCWIMDDNWLNGVFWGPLTICLFVGITFIVLILYEVYQIVVNVDTGQNRKARIIKYNLKPFVIIMFIFVEFVYMFAYHFYTQQNKDNYQMAMVEYAMCKLNPYTTNNCDIETLPYAGHFIYLFFIRLIGVEVMVFYGINRRAKKIWQTSFLFNNRFYVFSWEKYDHNAVSPHHQQQQNQKRKNNQNNNNHSGSADASNVSTFDESKHNNNNKSTSDVELNQLSSPDISKTPSDINHDMTNSTTPLSGNSSPSMSSGSHSPSQQNNNNNSTINININNNNSNNNNYNNLEDEDEYPPNNSDSNI